MDPKDNFFDLGGHRAEVIAALQASAAEHPNGVLRGAKEYVISQLQASTLEWGACSLRYLVNGDGLAAVVCNWSVHPSLAKAHGMDA